MTRPLIPPDFIHDHRVDLDDIAQAVTNEVCCDGCSHPKWLVLQQVTRALEEEFRGFAVIALEPEDIDQSESRLSGLRGVVGNGKGAK